MNSNNYPFTGKTWDFVYDGFSARDTFISDSIVQFEVLTGPFAGVKGQAEYQAEKVSETLYQITWQEEDGGTVVHLDDFEHGISRSHYTNSHLQFFAMKGSIRPVESR